MASKAWASVRGQFNGDELDLRKELKELFDGDDFGNEKKAIYIHRKIRQDKFGVPVKCTCFVESSGEGAQGCPHCDGYGFLWDEHIITGFKYPISDVSSLTAGNMSRQLGRRYDIVERFITMHEIDLGEGDRIIEPSQQDNGEIYIPIIPDNTWYVNFSTARRLDFGKEQFTDVLVTRIS